MIILSNSTAQTLAAGQSLTFDTVILHTGCAECHRNNSGSVGLVAKGAIYDVSFHANIGGVEAGDAQLSIVYEGSPLNETLMQRTTATAGDLDNVGADTGIKTCCCGSANVIVVNTGTTPINVGANPCLKIRRVA